MRIKSTLAALTVLSAILVALPWPASAGVRHDRDGWGREHVATHRVNAPRYSHRYYGNNLSDPYHYRYVQPRYYPVYNSGYWVPARHYRKARKHYVLPHYYKAWGYPKHCKRDRDCYPYRHHHRHHRHHR